MTIKLLREWTPRPPVIPTNLTCPKCFFNTIGEYDECARHSAACPKGCVRGFGDRPKGLVYMITDFEMIFRRESKNYETWQRKMDDELGNLDEDVRII